MHTLVLALVLVATVYAINLPGDRVSPTSGSLQSALLGGFFSHSSVILEGGTYSSTVFLGGVPIYTVFQEETATTTTTTQGLVQPSTASTHPDSQTAPSLASPTPSPSPTPEVQDDRRERCERVPGRLYCIYTAQSGDTLSEIAHSFGILGAGDLTPAQVLAQNNQPYIADTNEVFVGQNLRVPVVSGVLHIVLEVETLDEVAGAYGVTPQSIVDLPLNGITDPSLLVIGHEILIPNPTRLPLLPFDEAGVPLDDDEAEAELAASEDEAATEPEDEAIDTLEAQDEAGSDPEPARQEPEPTATPAPPAATPAPAPARPASSSRVYQPDELRPLLAHFPWNVDDALRVIYGPTARCPTGESSGRAGAVGASGEAGLFQISPVHAWRFERQGWSWADAVSAEHNIAIAYEIYSEAGGWWPWSCRP